MSVFNSGCCIAESQCNKKNLGVRLGALNTAHAFRRCSPQRRHIFRRLERRRGEAVVRGVRRVPPHVGESPRYGLLRGHFVFAFMRRRCDMQNPARASARKRGTKVRPTPRFPRMTAAWCSPARRTTRRSCGRPVSVFYKAKLYGNGSEFAFRRGVGPPWPGRSRPYDPDRSGHAGAA